MKIFISGFPGCGKTSLILELIEYLKAKGKKIAGIVSTELRKDRTREGFLIKDIVSGRQEIMASKTLKAYKQKGLMKQKKEFMVGKYFVNTEAIDRIVKEAEKSFEEAEFIFIDEIGKMELFSNAFKQMLAKLIASNKILIATVHRAYIEDYKKKGLFFWLERHKIKQIKEEIIDLLNKIK